MSLLRQHIIGPIILWVFLLGAASFGLSYTLGIYTEDMLLQLGTGFGFFTVSTSLLLIFKLHKPMQAIILEMKALLTGKSYRRIMTSKRNELGVLAHFFNEITRNLENISGDVKSHERIKKELNIAQKIQRDLIPDKAPDIPGLLVTAKTRPASEIGGDTFDFFVQEKRTLMYIGDSTGHGVPAGIVMVMVDTLIETFIDMYEDLTEIIISLNKYLKPHLQTTMFMTMIFAEWIPETAQFNWVGCGHEYVIHMHTAENRVETIPAGGIAVGMLPDNSKMVKEQTLQLAENDFVVLYSDGINEAKNVNGQIYTLERLAQFIKEQSTAETTADDLFKAIAIDVGRFMEGHTQEDDMTLIVIKRSSQNIQKTADAASTEWSTNAETSAAPSAPTSVAPA